MSPWILSKSADNESNPIVKQELEGLIDSTVYHSAEAIRIIGILLQPYMPNKAAQLLDMIGVTNLKRTFADARLGGDPSYGTPTVFLGTCAHDGLFPPLAVQS